MRLSGVFGLCLLGVLLTVGFHPFGLPYQPEAVFSDAVVSHWGAADRLRESIWSGTYPLWQETILGGGPFAANPLNKTAYPLQWLVVVLPPLTHLNLMILLHLILAALGAWHWGRVLGLCPTAALLSVLVYTLSPRLWGHLGAGHLDILYALAWFPWLLWLLHIGDDGRPLLHILRLALVGALLVLADVRVSLFAGLFGVGYAVWRAVEVRQVRFVLLPLAALVVCVPLVAALVVPLIGWGPFLSRGLLTPEAAAVFSVDLLGFAGLLLPAHQGEVETMVYLGLPTFVLAAIGWGSRPAGARWFWGSAVLLAGVWAAGVNTPLWDGLTRLGFLTWFRVPGRAWFVVMAAAAPLAGFGLQALMAVTDGWREADPPPFIFWLRLAAAGTAGLMAVCGGTLLLTGIGSLPTSAGVMLLVNSVGLGVVLMAVLLQRARTSFVAVLLLSLTYADLTVTAANRVEWRGTDAWIEPYLPLAQRLLEEFPQRVYSPDYALPQQVAQLTGLRLFYGVDPFQLEGMVRAIEAGSGVPVTEYAVIIPPLRFDEGAEGTANANIEFSPNPAALARWHVSHIVASYPYEMDGLTYLDTVDGVNIYRNQVYVDLAFDDTPGAYASLLPTPGQIRRLHRWTVGSVWVSAVAFVAVGGGITLLSFRKERSHG